MAKRRTRLRGDPPAPEIISEFQPDAVEIEESTPPRTTCIMLYTVAVLIVAAVLWGRCPRSIES